MTELMRRRRALMAQGGGAQELTLNDLETASVVKMSADTTTKYIYCGLFNGNALLLREVVYAQKKFRTSGYPDYEGSIPDTYLLNDIYPTFSDLAKSKMVDTTFDITYGDGSTTGTKSITRKIFVPSTRLIGSSGQITTVLKKYHGTTTTNTARIAKDSDGTARGYWTSDAYSATNVYVIGATGGTGSGSVSSSSYYVRGCLTMDKNTEVELIDGAYVLKGA